MLWNPLFKGSESLWQQNSFTESCCVCQRRWASRTCCRWCCWWMTATSCDMELTAFKSAKGCELIATAFGWPSVPGISLLPPTESEARNISLREEVSWMWQNILQVCCNRFQAVPQHAWVKQVACCHLLPCDCAWKSPLPFPLLKGWTRAGYHPLLPGEFMQQKPIPALVVVVRGHALHLVAAFHFSKKHLKIGNAFCSDFLRMLWQNARRDPEILLFKTPRLKCLQQSNCGILWHSN